MVVRLLQFLCKFFPHSVLNLYLILVFLLGLSACATLNSKLEISYLDRDSLNFTGRGSAAGVMLDAVMDGAGIAIGIAIDQGIAKDISKNILLHDSKFDFRELIRQRVSKSSVSALESIKIKTYGFKSAPGDDKVSAWLELDIVKNGTIIQVKYPEDFTDVNTEKFIKVKEDAAIAVDLLVAAIDAVIKVKLIKANN
jgi:hypothetical protein